MPFEIEHEGKTVKVWTEEEVDSEVKGLKVTNENLKAEKQEASDKLKEAKEATRQAEEAKAKAEGDNEALQRIADEREAEKRQAVEDERKKFSDLLNMTKKEKITNKLNEFVNEVGAGGTRNEDLRDLLKSRFEFDFDVEKGEFVVKGDGVSSIDDLKKAVTGGDRYKSYLAGSGATGGGATGSRSTGGADKKFNEYSGAELKAIKDADPAQYERLKTDYYGK